MKPYIFISCDGQTKMTDRFRENLKVLGFGVGNNAQEAFESFMSENEYVTSKYFDEMYCFPLDITCEGKKHWIMEERKYFSIQNWSALPNPFTPPDVEEP